MMGLAADGLSVCACYSCEREKIEEKGTKGRIYYQYYFYRDSIFAAHYNGSSICESLVLSGLQIYDMSIHR